ncbi:MAG: PqqD family protein [Wenzhouxiangellaceae bacterium]|nr:PqqD family protein [Wenzhouxiangellaceae bacterium]
MSEPAIARIKQALQSQRLTINALDDGSGVLLDVEGEQMLTLNRTGMRLVQAIDEGAESLQVLASVMTGQFEVSSEQAENDARAFIDEIAAAL